MIGDRVDDWEGAELLLLPKRASIAGRLVMV